MIGGPDAAVRHLDPVFATLAPGRSAPPPPGAQGGGTAALGYLHCGPSGAGHFVKMVHNGIEYGVMAAYAEGMNILKAANAGNASARRRRDQPAARSRILSVRHRLAAVAEVWRHGSVIGSWLLDLTAGALLERSGAGASSADASRIRAKAAGR